MSIAIQAQRPALTPVCPCASHRRFRLWIFRGLLGIHTIGSCWKLVPLMAPWEDKTDSVLSVTGSWPEAVCWGHLRSPYWLSVPHVDSRCCYTPFGFVPWTPFGPSLIFSFRSSSLQGHLSVQLSSLCASGGIQEFPSQIQAAQDSGYLR